MDRHQDSSKPFSFYSVIIQLLLIVVVSLGLGACGSGKSSVGGLQGGGSNPEATAKAPTVLPGAARWYARHNRSQSRRSVQDPLQSQIARSE